MACQQKRNQADTVCLDRMIYLLHTNFMSNKFENIEHVDPNFLVLDNFRYQECSMFEISCICTFGPQFGSFANVTTVSEDFHM